LTVDRMMDFHLLSVLWSAIIGLIHNLRFDSQSLLPFPINALIRNLCSHFQYLLSFTYFAFSHNFPLFREWKPTLPGYLDWHCIVGRVIRDSFSSGRNNCKWDKHLLYVLWTWDRQRWGFCGENIDSTLGQFLFIAWRIGIVDTSSVYMRVKDKEWAMSNEE
jgi:hypothetical protein